MNQSAAKRLLLVLEFLTGHPNGAGLTDMCEALDLPKSIGHRLLALLIETGYVVQHSPNGRYSLTLKLTTLGMRHYVRTGLDDLAQPILDQVAAETGELARLALVEGERLIWVAKAQGARSGLRYDPGIDHDSGHDVVLHATATGKAWLATLPEEQALRIVAATGLHTPPRSGPNAAKNLASFRLMLQSTRLSGFGEAIDEGEPGTAAVAVAIMEASGAGAAVGTLSLAGPLLRLDEKRRRYFAARLRIAARELSGILPLRPHRGGPPAKSLAPGRLSQPGPKDNLVTNLAPLYEGPLVLSNARSQFNLLPLRAADFTQDGPRADAEYRDLGLDKATGGRVGGKHIRAVRSFTQETGWHWHDMNSHFIYVLRGSISFRFEGVPGIVTACAGACLSQPAGVPHNVIARSDDLELIEINLPAQFGTFDLASPPALVPEVVQS